MSSDEAEKQKEAILTIIENQDVVNERYSNIRRLGVDGCDGYFSFLFKATDNNTGQEVALKFFDPRKTLYAERVLRFEREAQMLLSLSDETYVINAIEGLCNLDVPCKTDTGIEFVQSFQFIPIELANGNVEEFILSNPPPSAIDSLICFKELVKAVAAIHRRRICHRDLKPGNFLFVNGDLRLSDFGTAKDMSDDSNTISPKYEVHVGDMKILCS